VCHNGLLTWRRGRLRARSVMRDVRQPARNWVFALLGLLLLVVVVFLYVTGGRLPGMSNSPTAEISGKTAQ
jgi:hypothetical protein